MDTQFPTYPSRQNHTRDESFWRTINWLLPDGVLADIWGVDRGNLHARRIRLCQSPPRWRIREDKTSPVLNAAIQLEILKARKFTGPKPANSHISKRGLMRIAAEVSLELIKRHDDGRAMLELHIRLIGVEGKLLSADIVADEDLNQPSIVASVDAFGLTADDRQALALANYNHMRSFFGDGPTGGTITWARWVEVDFAPWIGESLYHPASARIIRVISSQMSSHPSGIAKSFTESLEV